MAESATRKIESRRNTIPKDGSDDRAGQRAIGYSRLQGQGGEAGGWSKRGCVGVVAYFAVRQMVVPKSPAKTCRRVSHWASPYKRAGTAVGSARADVVQVRALNVGEALGIIDGLMERKIIGKAQRPQEGWRC